MKSGVIRLNEGQVRVIQGALIADLPLTHIHRALLLKLRNTLFVMNRKPKK